MSYTEKKRPLIVRFFKYFIPWKGDRAGEVVRKIVMLIAIAVFIGSACYIANYYWTRWNSQKGYEALESNYSRGDTSVDEVDNGLPEGYLARFADLYAQNPDIKGWISIENTNISFPVVQAADNDEYLYKNFNGEYDIFGTPFLDYRNTLELDKTSENLLIYGHHMNGKRVFGQLVNYKDLDFYKEHPVVQFDSVYEEADWKIIAVFVTNVNPEDDNGNVFDYQNYLDLDEEQFNTYVEEVRKRSYFDTDIDVQYGDKLVSLSTCSYEFTDARTVLVARKVRDGESSEVDVSTATINTDAYYPAAMR